MNNSLVKNIICLLFIILLTTPCIISMGKSSETDWDNDGLSNEREEWWLCDKNNNDSNNDGHRDGESVNGYIKHRPYKKDSINIDNDQDQDGIPDRAEDNIIKTDSRVASTDGDPFSDGEEFFGINMPTISPPSNHPLVAAYPNLNIYLDSIKIHRKSDITTSNGKSANQGWTIATETSDGWANSIETGLEMAGRFGLQDLGVDVAASVNNIEENTHITTNSQSTSGFTQDDWSTAFSNDTTEAAIIDLELRIKNCGTIAAEDINPTVDITLGDHIIRSIAPGDKITIPSLGVGREQGFAISGITITLDELRCIDSGTPLSIETRQLSAATKKWNPGISDWSPSELSYNSYMNEINSRTATLMHKSKDGTYREYKVYAGRPEAPVTLGDAINLTIGKNIREIGNGKLDIVFSSSSADAFVESKNLAEANESVFNLNIKPGQQILIKELGGETTKPPMIHWAGIDRDLKTIRASVTDDLGVFNVTAHIKIKGRYQDFLMGEINRDTIYTRILPEEIDEDGNNYIKAINLEGNSTQLNLSIPKKLLLRDGDYMFSAKDPNFYMTADGKMISQDYYNGGSNQIWTLASDENGCYSIRNSQTNQYLAKKGKAIMQDPTIQKWSIEPAGDGCYRICNNESCLAIQENKPQGSTLSQAVYSDDDSQNWKIQPAKSFPVKNLLTFNPPVDYYIFIADHSKKCLELDWRYDIIDQNNYYGNINQKWGLRPVGDGYFEIFNMYNNNCLEVINSPRSNNSSEIQVVVKNSYQGRDCQNWYFEDCADGYYGICLKNSELCLAIDNSSPEDGARVKHEEWIFNENQKWKLLPVMKTAINVYHNGKPYNVPLAGINGHGWWSPSEIKNSDIIFELIPLGKDVGTNIVAFKKFDSHLFIKLLRYESLKDGWASVDNEKYRWAPREGLLSFSEVLNDKDIFYEFEIKPEGRTDDTSVEIKCGDRNIQMVSDFGLYWLEARDYIIRGYGVGRFTFDHQA